MAAPDAAARTVTDAPAYDTPDAFANLDELQATPVENADEGAVYRHHSLEETRTRERAYQQALADGAQEDQADAGPGPGPDADTARRASPAWTQLYTVAYLVLFSFWGDLARVGLQALTDYPGAPVALGSLWPNFAGCLVMGFLAEDRVLFRPRAAAETKENDDDDAAAAAQRAHLAAKKTIPLYIGLATGFCGSFTSFSAFARDLFLALANSTGGTTHPHRNGGDSFMAVLAVALLTVLLSLGGFVLGAHLALLLAAVVPSSVNIAPPRRCRRAADRLAVVLALGLWTGAVLMVALPPDRHRGNSWRGKVTFGLVFAPLGTLARYGLALGLNGRAAAFPLGTYAANIAGTLLLALFWDLAHAPRGGVVGCQVLQGLEDGFCGCLTTVSTWVAEMTALHRRHAYVYGGASVLGALAIMAVVMGSLRWTDGFAPLQCAT